MKKGSIVSLIQLLFFFLCPPLPFQYRGIVDKMVIFLSGCNLTESCPSIDGLIKVHNWKAKKKHTKIYSHDNISIYLNSFQTLISDMLVFHLFHSNENNKRHTLLQLNYYFVEFVQYKWLHSMKSFGTLNNYCSFHLNWP